MIPPPSQYLYVHSPAPSCRPRRHDWPTAAEAEGKPSPDRESPVIRSLASNPRGGRPFPLLTHAMDESEQTLPLACRFIPLDQWLVTHVNPKWKVRTVKYWMLKKCGAPHDFELPQPARRPPSPIVFAQGSQKKKRAISPIQFAQTKVPGRINSDDEAVGYEEDDEESESAKPTIVHPQVPQSTEPEPPAKRKVKTKSKVVLPHEMSPYDPERLSLMRFSTGQVLEDDYTLEWYEIGPNELIEIHRANVFVRLPRLHPFAYCQPYWEGWVKALRVVGSSGRKSENDGQKLEWRPRWVVVREGELSLCKDRMESPPSKSLSLSHLADLRGAEHLLKSTAIVPEPNQRIICAKFKVRNTTTRVSYDATEESSSTFTVISTSKTRKPVVPRINTTRKRASTISHTPIRSHENGTDTTDPDGEDKSDSTLSSPVFAHEDASDDDLLGSEDVNALLGMRTTGHGYKYRGTKAIPSTPPNSNTPAASSTPPGAQIPNPLNFEIGEWIVLDLPDDNTYTSLLRTLHRQFPHESQSIAQSSTFVGGLLPTLESPPETPLRSPLQSSTVPSHPSIQYSSSVSDSKKPGLPPLPKANALGAMPFPEWRFELVRRARRAGLGNITDSMGCLLLALEHTDVENPEDDGASKYDVEVSSEYGDSVAPLPERQDDEEGHDIHLDVSDSDSDASQVEWEGWMADLHRQGRNVRAAPSLAPTAQSDETSRSIERYELEPSGIVFKGFTPTSPPPNAVSLSSPSSNESLYRASLRRSEHRRPSMPTISLFSGNHSRQDGSSSTTNTHSRQSSSLSQRPSMPSLNRAASVSVLKKDKGKQREEDPLSRKERKKKNRLSNPLPGEEPEEGGSKKKGFARHLEKMINGLEPNLDFVDTR